MPRLGAANSDSVIKPLYAGFVKSKDQIPRMPDAICDFEVKANGAGRPVALRAGPQPEEGAIR